MLLDGRSRLNMLVDFYEFTMVNALFENDMQNRVVYFDMFFRKVPDNGGFSIMAGLSELICYLKGLSFSDSDIDYLRTKGVHSEKFLGELRNFKFLCDVWSVPEGTVVFPGEPIITVKGPIYQAQLIETMLLLIINHQSLIATKANRIVRAARGREVMEFGSRRAHGADSAVFGAKAAFIAGCSSTANTLCDVEWGIPAVGTMAHSWIQMFDCEIDAFRAYAKVYPNGCMLLVDTYDTLNSGVPNAIKVFCELSQNGYRPKGIRIDSGDISYLSSRARKMLDDAGFSDAKICASNSLDEYLIREMILEGAKVDSFGVGEKLITSASSPMFGGVYKLCAVEDSTGKIIPKIKISDNVSKITTPGVKSLWRLYDRNTNKALADVLTFEDEIIDDEKPYEIFSPDNPWKKKVVSNFKAMDIRKQIFKDGICVYEEVRINDIREYCKSQVDSLWEEVTRFENPHNYYVDLSQRLWNVKNSIISNVRNHMV